MAAKILFRIEWKDPETNEDKEAFEEFESTEDVTAREWAEDWAYARADKGWYRITVVQRKVP